MEWEMVISSEETLSIAGVSIEVFYDETASSPWSAWKAFIKGIGTSSAECREFAIERAWKRLRNI